MALKQFRNTLNYKDNRPSMMFFKLCGYNPYPHQEEIHMSRALYRVVSIARQHGKSTLATIEAAFELSTKPNTVGYIVAPEYKQAKIIFKNVVALMMDLVKELPHIRITQLVRGGTLLLEVTHYDEDGEVIGTAIMEGRSASNPDSLRGGTTNWIIVDEAAMVSSEALEEGLIPTGTTTKPWMLFISTPKGVNNWFFTFYLRGQDPMFNRIIPEIPTTYRSWKIGATDIINKHTELGLPFIISPEELAQKKRTTDHFTYMQEYEAEFLADSGAVFIGLESVPKYEPASISTEGIFGEDPIYYHSYYIGADFAKYNDFTVFTIMDSTTNKVVRRIRLNTIDLTQQLKLLKQLSDLYNGALVVADITGMGIPLEEQMVQMGIPVYGYNLTNKSKDELIAKLSLGIQNKYVTLLNDPITLGELASFGYTRTQSGGLKMSATAGHDDCVISLALAWWFCTASETFIEVNDDDITDYYHDYSFDYANELLKIR